MSVLEHKHPAPFRLDDLQAEQHYSSMRAYGQSKTRHCPVHLRTCTQLQGTGVTANCLDPGFVATNIGQRGASIPVRLLIKLIWSFGTSIDADV